MSQDKARLSHLLLPFFKCIAKFCELNYCTALTAFSNQRWYMPAISKKCFSGDTDNFFNAQNWLWFCLLVHFCWCGPFYSPHFLAYLKGIGQSTVRLCH